MAKKSFGKLRERITIQQPEKVRDSGGGYNVTWADVKTVFAYIEPVSFGTKIRAEQLEHNVSHKIIVRHQVAEFVRSDYRIIFQGRIFQIKGFRNIEERGRFIEIMANEGDPA